MKHFLNKKMLQGGGKSKPKPQPAILRPPEIGNFKILNSYSVAEVVDLVSDGPIMGLVNQNGQDLGKLGQSILQGIYLDNTPIQTTSTKLDESANTDIIYSIDIHDILNKFGDQYYDYNTNSYIYKETRQSVPSKNLNIDYNVSNLLVANNLANKTYFSFFTDSGQWSFIGKKSSTSPQVLSSDISAYFSGSGADAEIHYRRDSLFITNTILNKLETELSAEANSNINNTLQRSVVANAQTNLKNFKSQYFDSLDHNFDWEKSQNAFLVVKIGSRNSKKIISSLNTSLNSAADPSDNKKLANTFFSLGKFANSFPASDIQTILVPSIDSNNNYKNEIFGCLIFRLTLYPSQKSVGLNLLSNSMYFNNTIPFSSRDISINFYKGAEKNSTSKASKYNFLNVSAEFNDGSETQEPLQYFKNIFVDFDYNSRLIGPFRTSRQVQRLLDLNATNVNDAKLNMSLSTAIVDDGEGSLDTRALALSATQDYASWNADNYFDEDAIAITHTVENPNVNSVYVTLAISSLSDTVEIDRAGFVPLPEPGKTRTVNAGSKIPSILNIKVEYGKMTNGQIDETSKMIRVFSVMALIEGQMLLDLGCPDSKVSSDLTSTVKEFSSADNSLEEIGDGVLFSLPELQIGENPTDTKRYIKVTKLSTETNSILINKEVLLNKVTEIVDNQLSYPFSSLVGIKLDARSFSSVPERSYDCRLKKIKIPKNYFPLNADGSDKRYINKNSSYDSSNQIYLGDWDGTFQEGWTDNPAWIIYDLLTSKRYGLGSYIEESQINKWELYKIARFCDAVNDDGYFIGISDGVGGLEPRYSCNIVFREQTKIFDAINVVASLFRGIVFFSNSEIHFLDDRPRIPIAIFSNTNVKDGIFNYTNMRRDQQFNTVEVAYLDRFDNYQSKIEYVQDELDIRKRGIFKTTINTLGVTSRAMARRIGQHIIYQTIKENQTIEFTAGLESLLCRPGDLVIVEDELKTRSSNYGRILDINVAEKSLTIDNAFDSESLNNTITVYTPTGYSTSQELNDLQYINRSRSEYFDVTTGLINSSYNYLTGRYYFSGYTDKITGIDYLYGIQYPIYTGKSSFNNENLYCYYSMPASGFIFSTGKSYQNNTVYDKIISNTGLSDIFGIMVAGGGNKATGFVYKTNGNYRDTVSGSISGAFKFRNQNESYQGALSSEIESTNHSQITRFALSGYAPLDFGSKVYISGGDINVNLVSKIALGSPYRLERKNASDQIYKIISIREQNQNEYSVVASKYNTGKFVEIENFIAEDFLPNTYSDAPLTINNVQINQLSTPVITSFSGSNLTANGFSLASSWQTGGNGVTGNKVEIYNTLSNEYYSEVFSSNISGYLLTDLTNLGQWKFKLTYLADGRYLNSDPKETGAFVAYSGTLTAISKPIVSNFSIT
jgi:hypothetical protein